MVVAFEEQCHTINNKYLVFDLMPNMVPEMLVIGLGGNLKPTTLTLTLSQKPVLGIKFYYYIFVGIAVFAAVLAVVWIGVIILRRRRSLRTSLN